jgi:hypothetical protein
LDAAALVVEVEDFRFGAAFPASGKAGLAAVLTGSVRAGRSSADFSGAASSSSATASAGSALATLMVLDSVRWHVSQVTMVRSNEPS